MGPGLRKEGGEVCVALTHASNHSPVRLAKAGIHLPSTLRADTQHSHRRSSARS